MILQMVFHDSILDYITDNIPDDDNVDCNDDHNDSTENEKIYTFQIYENLAPISPATLQRHKICFEDLIEASIKFFSISKWWRTKFGDIFFAWH